MVVVKKNVLIFFVVVVPVIFFVFMNLSALKDPVNQFSDYTSNKVSAPDIASENEVQDFFKDFNIHPDTLVIGLTDMDLPGAESFLLSMDNTKPRLQSISGVNELFQLSTIANKKNQTSSNTGEQLPDNIQIVLTEPHERQDYEAQEILIVKGAEAKRLYFPIIKRVADKYDLDPLLVKAIIEAESGFDPLAVSKVGARGLMQLMPPTAKAMGVKDSFNPEHNIAGGVKYFKKMLDRFDGDIKLALAAYNAGSRKVRQYRGIPPYAETRFYIRKVCKLHKIYIRQQRYSAGNV